MTTAFTQTRIEIDNSSYRKGRDKTNSATTLPLHVDKKK